MIPEFNTRALKMFQKVGYQVEGTLRHRFFGRGRYWNMIVTSAVRDGWRPDVGDLQASRQTGVQSPNSPSDSAARPLRWIWRTIAMSTESSFPSA